MNNRDTLLDKSSLCDKVYDYLKEEIMLGKLSPGEKMPEIDIANTLSVSRAPVREALNMLARDGFVVRVPRHGAIVAPVTWKEINENWELRRLMEPYAAKLACGNIPRKELEAVRRLIEDTIASDSYTMYMDSDYRTHSIIYKYVSNEQFKNFLDQTMQNSMRYRYYVENNHPGAGTVISTVCKEHLAIVDALIHNDAEQAYVSMLSHIELGFRRIDIQLDSTVKLK